jgi:hypothetical protein
MRVLLLLVLALEPIGPKNWLHHPKIEEVRSIVAAVDAAALKKRTVGCESESRIWFGEDGKKLWSTYRFTGEGPGFNIDGSPDFIVRAPKQHFASRPQPCGEEK